MKLPPRRSDLELLVEKRWDPRRGVGRELGAIRAWLTTAFLLMLVFGRYLVPLFPIHPAWGTLSFYLPAVGLIFCWLLPIGIRKRTKRRYKKHNGFLCPWCRYPLTDLSDEGICPECGAGYERSVCVMLYDCAYREYQPDQFELKRREREAWGRALAIKKQSPPPQRGGGL